LNQIINVLKQLPQSHLLATCFTLALVCSFLYLQKEKGWSSKTKIFRLFVYSPLLIELIYQLSSLLYGVWSVESSLPLEFSYITSLSILTYLILNHEKINGWLYFAGIWSSSASFLNSIMLGNEAWFIFLRYYGHHGILLFFGLRSLYWGFRPKRKDYFSAIALTAFILLSVHIINYFLKTNYMFTYSRPMGANISQLMPQWPDYLILILGIGIFYYTLLYLLGREKKST